jgi:hypothetical protein
MIFRNVAYLGWLAWGLIGAIQHNDKLIIASAIYFVALVAQEGKHD